MHGHVRLQPAGTSANAAVWAAWDGADVRVHGCVGDDLTGRLLRRGARGSRGGSRADGRRPGAVRGHARRRRGGGALHGRRPRRERAPDARPTCRRRSKPAPCWSPATCCCRSRPRLPASPPIERAHAPFVAVEASSWPLVEAFGADRFLRETTGSGANVLLANEREVEVLTGLSGDRRRARAGGALPRRVREARREGRGDVVRRVDR